MGIDNKYLFWKNENIRIYNGHVLDVLETIPDKSINCIVSSPPYWGQRTYENAVPIIWGGSVDCDHSWRGVAKPPTKFGIQGNTQGIGKSSIIPVTVRMSNLHNTKSGDSQICTKCNAFIGVYGGEPTYQLYVQNTVLIFNALWRILRDDGVIYWNIGDSYFGSNQGYGDVHAEERNALQNVNDNFFGSTSYKKTVLAGSGDGIVKAKDLVGIPQRVRLALQEAGWHIRSNIIWAKCIDVIIDYNDLLFDWAKKNNIVKEEYDSLVSILKDNTFRGSTQPEPSKDRPVRAYEDILMVTKNSRYYWDYAAVTMDFRARTKQRVNYKIGKSARASESTAISGTIGNKDDYKELLNNVGANSRNVWAMNTAKGTLEMCRSCKKVYVGKEFKKLKIVKVIIDGEEKDDRVCLCGERNWLSHFASFPVQLPERCILSGSPEKICSVCNKPYRRILETVGANTSDEVGIAALEKRGLPRNTANLYVTTKRGQKDSLGIVQDCECGLHGKKSIILDPFSGSGTTGIAAIKTGRNCVLIDSSVEYCNLSKGRIEKYLIDEKLEEEKLAVNDGKKARQLQLI